MAINFVNSLISKLGSGKRDLVYISITPNVGVEIAQIDSTNRVVKQYGYKPLEYNEALKEIKDYDELETAIKELYTELGLNPKSSAILSIPTVYMGKMELPLILSDEMIQEAIISEVEQAYIFKRCEPIVSWVEVFGNQDSENRTMIYSAIQKPVIDSIKEVLASIGVTIEKLEISLTSDIRGLAYTGLAESQMVEGTPWTLMIIKSNGYELVQMNGKRISDFYSEPLALKTYDLEEIYDAINTSVQIALLSYPTNNIVILSETDMVSAEHLAEKMQIEGNVTFIDNNDYRKQNLMPVSLQILPNIASKISLEAIGTAAYYIQNMESEFEFSGNSKSSSLTIQPIYINWKGKQYEITEIMMIYAILALSAVLISTSLFALLTFSSVEKKIQKKLNNINAQISDIDSQITKLKENSSDGNFDINGTIEKVIKNNRTKLIAYSAIGESIPKKIWLKYFSTREDGKFDIVGVSETVEDIYIFYRNLKDSIIDSQLRLNKLEMQADSIEDVVLSSSNYEFEITNLSEKELQDQLSGDKSSDNDKDNKNKKDTNDKKDKSDNGNKSDNVNKGDKKAVKDLEEVEVH